MLPQSSDSRIKGKCHAIPRRTSELLQHHISVLNGLRSTGSAPNVCRAAARWTQAGTSDPSLTILLFYFPVFPIGINLISLRAVIYLVHVFSEPCTISGTYQMLEIDR